MTFPHWGAGGVRVIARQFSLIHQLPPIELLAPAADAAGRTSSYRSLKNALKAWIVCHLTQGAANTVTFAPWQATTVAGGSGKVLATATRIWSSLDTSLADTLTERTAAVNYTTDAGTPLNKMVIFEIVPEACMDVANGFDCIAIASGASNAANITQAMLYIIPAIQGGSRPDSYLN